MMSQRPRARSQNPLTHREFFDHDVFSLTGISGHTLKHLASAVGAWWV
jgi:hypothetical protein